MKWIKYQIMQSTNGEETVLINKKVNYSDENLHIAEQEAYNGYEIIDDEDIEIEWLNPPMMEDVEYRTTERYNGLPVYVKRTSIIVKAKPEDDENTNSKLQAGPPIGSKVISISAIVRDTESSGSLKNDVNTIEQYCNVKVVPFMANMFPDGGDYLFMDVFIYGKFNGTVECTMKYVKGE